MISPAPLCGADSIRATEDKPRFMPAYESFRSLLFRLDPERAHKLTLGVLAPLPAPKLVEQDPALAVVVAGIPFPTPVGLAAGFDKNAIAPGRMLGFGFGSVEVGTVTPLPQPGNESPRLFRLVEDEAIINRFGFNSDGHEVVQKRLAKRQQRSRPGIVGVNLGANKESLDKIADYVAGVHKLGPFADYLTINISSPNTPGLRNLQSEEHLASLVGRVIEAREAINGPPIFLKVSPDLSDSEVVHIARTSIRGGVDGLIVGNTTVSRPPTLASEYKHEIGGLSGKPLKQLAMKALEAFRAEVGSRLPLIGVGGISTADDAYERIKAGASLLQLYTALPYRGPGLVSEINEGLLARLQADGYRTITEAVGTGATQSHHIAAA